MFDRTKHNLAAVAAMFALVSGCDSPPSRIYQIDASSTTLAAALIDEGDKDKNRALSTDELKSMPYVAPMAAAYDANRDHLLSEQEIADRLGSVVFDPRKALATGEFVVTRKGSPLAGAEVRLLPAPGLVDYLPIATGKSNRDGIARMTMEAEHRPANAPNVAGLIRPGLYRIEVTHPSIPVPAKYNEQTTLGVEVSTATLSNGPIPVQLDF